MQICTFILILLQLYHLNNNVKSNKAVLIPLPDSVKWINGEFLLKNETGVYCSDDNLTKYCIMKINEFTGLTVKRNNMSNSAGQINIYIDSTFYPSCNEAYSLSVSKHKIEIKGNSNNGIFLGLQTLFQLIPPESKIHKGNNPVQIQACEIIDKPKFSWRGLNLDCSRHFMTKDFIKRYIDILAYYKFNTFHWHLTDDQGWRIEIKKYPKLTSIGAWRKEPNDSVYGGYYSQDDIKEIVYYAQSRFINIIPEIEMPGHSTASLAAYPENSCTGGPFEVVNTWGVHKDIYCAGRDSTFYFLQEILTEVIDLFPGKYIHIGGDEAPKDRWKVCPKCQARIKSESLKDEKELQSYFIKRISKYLESKGKQVVGWDEILEGGLAPGALVQSWQSFQGTIEAAKREHFTICSPASHTYLNAEIENLDLRTAYSFKPIPDDLQENEKKFIIGSEVNLWTESAPQEFVDSKLFPRILALAEVFWNNPENKNYDEFHSRVQAAYNDLNALGIQYGRESKAITPVTSFDKAANKFIVKILKGQDNADIHYTIDGSQPGLSSPMYHSNDLIGIKNTTQLRIAAFMNDKMIGNQYILAFNYHKALNAKLTLKIPYDERYRAGGQNAVIDGICGTNNFRDGSWQGYEGSDFEGIIDLGKETEISKVTPRFFFDSNSWIFLPVKVDISLSTDNLTYIDNTTIYNNIPQKNSEILVKEFTAEFKQQKARFIKVKAENIKYCPVWHPGSGGKAWLFIDEIIVN